MTNKVLLVYTPSREGVGEGAAPLGLLYAAGAMERAGIIVKILDLYLYGQIKNDPYRYVVLKNAIDAFKPDIIGFGGIATSFTYAKVLSLKVKADYPKIMQIAGGSLSSISELLLKNTAVAIVFHGESERSLAVFFDKLNKSENCYETPGISYLKDGEVSSNQPLPQVQNLDEIPFPPYHLLDMEKYMVLKKDLIGEYKEDMVFQGLYDSIACRLKDVRRFFPLMTSRGCTNRCSFCYRQVDGFRQHSVEYVINHIKFIKEKFSVDGFDYMDELFNGDIKWVIDYCNAIEKNDLKIAYRIACRADKVSEEMLSRLCRTGCFQINYGQESGSDKILKEYRKGVNQKMNIETTLLTRKHYIYSTVLLVIGSPGETRETIMETVDFLKKVRVNFYSLKYLLPLPGAPIWDHVIKNSLISDLEDYLAIAARLGALPIINLTDVPDKEWKRWGSLIKYNMDLYNLKGSGNILKRLRVFSEYHLKKLLPVRLKKELNKYFKKY